MWGIEFSVSPCALLFFALLYFFDESGFYAAALPAAAVHELGHLLALKAAGFAPRRISLGPAGLEMDYCGRLEGLGGAFSIAAGPLFGLVYGLLIFSPWEYARFSGGISIALSAFNLLPVLPLDGGRLLELAVGERGRAASRAISLLLAAVGLWLWADGGVFAPFAMGLWLAWHNIKTRE